ncbi:hypothetical protein GIB67_022377 [Kingdonia uniflora]|uniref:Uncharacterized protein n=1 Tax=Kingdonia uniflora TaxID=39325 RepID=A0A7J7MTZ8_9MAGN|nr:hypothetical protein GIB67_022377 [Kingdonia uniflora]
MTVARVSYKSSRLRVQNKECHVMMNILDGKFDSDKYWSASKYNDPRTHPASNTYFVENVHSYKSVENVRMMPRFLNTGGKDVSSSNAAAPLVAGQSLGLRGVSGHMEDTLVAKRQSLPDGEVQSAPYKEKGKKRLAEALDDPRACRATVVVAIRGTLTLEASLLQAENLVSRNAELEQRHEEMEAAQKELVMEVVHRELADHVASVTAELAE